MKLFHAIALLGLIGTAHGAEVPTISIEQFAGDKPASRVENVETSHNQDGTVTVSALLTYADGQQENCTFVATIKPGTSEGSQGVFFTPNSRTCAPASSTN